MAKRALIYCRSKVPERINAQLISCRALAEKEQFEIAFEQFGPLSVRGTKPYKCREDLQNIVKRAQNGDFDVLIFSEISRIGRNMQVVLPFLKAMKQYRIEVYSVDMGKLLDGDGIQLEL